MMTVVRKQIEYVSEIKYVWKIFNCENEFITRIAKTLSEVHHTIMFQGKFLHE